MQPRPRPQAPGVTAIGNVRTGEVRVFGGSEFATAVDPGMADVIEMTWKEGSQAVFSQLGSDGVFVDDGYAKKHSLRAGSPVEITFPNGSTKTFVVKGVFDPPSGGSPFGTVTISAAAWDREVPSPENLFSFVKMAGGTTDENQAALDEALKPFPNAKAQTKGKFVESQIGPLKKILNILYILLALSVIISLFGIVNTLVLSVFERTREIGMLRAIGMTRRQVRRMIRHESIITALIGAVDRDRPRARPREHCSSSRSTSSSSRSRRRRSSSSSIAAIVVGIIAAIFPARRAARLDPLEAIAYE